MAEGLGKTYPLAEAIALMADIQANGPATEKLTQLTELLEESNKFVAGFVSFMVHEIRKPMTSIRGYSDMLRQPALGELNPQQQMFVETIRKNILSMQVLVEDISDVIKMRTGRIRSDAKMDMAKNILLAVEKANKDLAAERNITLEFDIPSGLPFVNLDTNRVTQALNKLVDNAVKYSPEGSKVLITARPAEGGLEILIKDDGVGMSAEELEQLGNLFFRGDDELVTNTKGYGMGIPIALECMNLVGGRLFYESEKGKGSLFGVFLPGMS